MVAPTAAPSISLGEKVESVEDIVQLIETIESLWYSLTGHVEANKHPPSSTVVDDSHSSKDKQRSSVGLGSSSTIEGNVSTGQSAQQNGHHFAETINNQYGVGPPTSGFVVLPLKTRNQKLLEAVRAKEHLRVKLLIEAKADVDLIRYGDTALTIAINNGDNISVKLLCESGASVNQTSGTNLPPLFLAISHLAKDTMSMPIVELLLKHGAATTGLLLPRRSALIYLIGLPGFSTTTFDTLWVAETLLTADAMINQRDDCGCTALIWAARMGDCRLMDFLLNRKAEINVQDEQGRTALMWASRAPYCENQVRLTNKLGLNYFLKTGELLLQKAAVRCLLLGRPAVSIVDNMGCTALVHAHIHGHNTIVDMLVEAGADKEKELTYYQHPHLWKRDDTASIFSYATISDTWSLLAPTDTSSVYSYEYVANHSSTRLVLRSSEE